MAVSAIPARRFVNAPISEQRRAARGRLVPPRRRLYRQHPRHPHLPDRRPAITVQQQRRLVEEDYNDVDTLRRPRRAQDRARRQLDGDRRRSWPRSQLSHGSFAQERGLGELQVQQFNPERFNDRWFQAALTVEGRIGNFDLTYAGAYMQRQIDGAVRLCRLCLFLRRARRLRRLFLRQCRQPG